MVRARYWAGTRRQQLTLSRAYRRAASHASSPADVVDAAFTIAKGDMNISPAQIRGEIIGLVSQLRAERPRQVLEIGTYKGGTLYLLAWASSDGARILSLDIQAFEPRRRRLYRSFARRDQTIEVWEADSGATETREAVKRFFEPDPIDVLFIDGDHTYESVARDFRQYYPLVRPGGWVVFHDIVDGAPHLVGEVPRFWREVKPSLFDPVELVESWTQGGFGIGIGRKARQPGEELQPVEASGSR